MNYTNLDLQARINSLMPNSPITVDGDKGPNTRRAVRAAMLLRDVETEEELFHESGLHRIVWHWSAGFKTPTEDDLKHYNAMHDYKGKTYDGAARPEDQANYDWRKGVGVSHTKNCNTGTIGQAVAGMYGAQGWPGLIWGHHRITWQGVDSMLKRSAEYCKKFDIPVTKWSTLSHAEVEETLKIKQNNKWYFMVLPGSTRTENAVKIGDILRARMISKYMK